MEVPHHEHPEFDRFEELLRALEVGNARIEGRLDTIAATKSGEHKHLEELISKERHRGRNTEVAASAIHHRLDVAFGDTGPIAKVNARVDGVAQDLFTLQRRIDRVFALAAGIGIGSGGIAAALTNWLLGG